MRNIKQQEKPNITEQQIMERKITTRENGSLRVQQDYSKTTSRTKQEFVRETDINNIVKYPMLENTEALTYADLTSPPNLREIFKSVHEVKETFAQLPSDIRKLMNNDPAQMESFIADKKNHKTLIDQGILIPRETKKSKTSQNQSETVQKENSTPTIQKEK